MNRLQFNVLHHLAIFTNRLLPLVVHIIIHVIDNQHTVTRRSKQYVRYPDYPTDNEY